MYLVTVEDNYGIWQEQPEGFNTLTDARAWVEKMREQYKDNRFTRVIIYACQELEASATVRRTRLSSDPI